MAENKQIVEPDKYGTRRGNISGGEYIRYTKSIGGDALNATRAESAPLRAVAEIDTLNSFDRTLSIMSMTIAEKGVIRGWSTR